MHDVGAPGAELGRQEPHDGQGVVLAFGNHVHINPAPAELGRERTVVEQHDRQTDVRAIGQIGRERRDLDFRPAHRSADITWHT